MKWLEQRQDYSALVANLFPKTKKYNDSDLHSACRNITIQLTEDCNCACTYCYQGNKTKKTMSEATGKAIVDFLFNEWYNNKDTGLINQTDTKAIILDFIGGEPLLNIEVADIICDYFWKRCIIEQHPWANYWMASFSSNGSLYFTDAFQKFLKKYHGHISYAVTVDGPEEIHDLCRQYKNGSGGNFKDAYAALINYKNNYDPYPSTKITISKDNLSKLNTIIDFFIINNINMISANVVFEHEWTIADGSEFYLQLKQLADSIFKNDKDIYVSLFNETEFCELNPDSIDDNRNFCGGTGNMLAFNPDGIAYPCLRYMESSLGTVKPLIIGDCKNGIYKTTEQKQLCKELLAITRKSQSTDNCFYCSIAAGCSWCSAWYYQEFGQLNKRSTRICNSHKARSLANVYFWNKYYIKENIPKYFHRYLSDEDSLKFISEDELNLLNNLEEQAKNRTNVVCSNQIKIINNFS